MTTLEAYCKVNGWQGGTIHGCEDHFAHLTLKQQDKICGYLVDNMSDISDINKAKDFLEARNQHLKIIGLSTRGAK